MGAGAFSPAPAAAPAASGVSVSSAQVPEEPAEATAMARCCLAIRQEARTAPPEQALMYGATLDICFEATGSRAGRTDPALAPRDALRIIRRNLGRTLLPRACDADGGTEP